MPEYFYNNQPLPEWQLLEAAKEEGLTLEEFLEQNPNVTTRGTESESDSSISINDFAVEDIKSPKIKHATVDEMKEGISWAQAEGDFVKKMNDYYDGTGFVFKEAVGGRDMFTMYDESTDTTSDAFHIPNFFEARVVTGSWEEVNQNVISFIDRDKKVDKEFKQQKTNAENIIAEKLEDNDFMTNLLGQDYDFSYVQKQEKGGKGEDYEIVLKALKKQVGEFGGILGGSFETNPDFSGMSEQAVERVIANAVTKKFKKDQHIKSNEK